jgi:hypothetical protein
MKRGTVHYVAAFLLSLGCATAAAQQGWDPYAGPYENDTENDYSGDEGNVYPYGPNDIPDDGGSSYDPGYYHGDNYRGPFGDYMSDGQCSFVNGVPVGNCD